VRAQVTEYPPSLENLRYWGRTMGSVYLVAAMDGEIVGCGRLTLFPGADPEIPEANVSVIPAARTAGIGSALLAEVSAAARDRGATALQGEVREDDDGSIRWVERRGFVEMERQKAVVLDLAATPAEDVDVPEGIVIASRAERPGLEREEYELVQRAGRDISGLDAETEQTFEQWHSFAVARPGADPKLCFVALAGDEIVGSANMSAGTEAGYHSLTTVAPEWRGRGIAAALKRSQIAAARERGLKQLVTESQQDNAPMRRLNEKLGFEPVPGSIVYRGPLA
jgi:ribosomal protein S18 acetylase RimI-like enzyme